jgi:hypothetical protein
MIPKLQSVSLARLELFTECALTRNSSVASRPFGSGLPVRDRLEETKRSPYDNLSNLRRNCTCWPISRISGKIVGLSNS